MAAPPRRRQLGGRAGAVGRTYAIAAGDLGAELRVVVTAVNADGETARHVAGPRRR